MLRKFEIKFFAALVVILLFSFAVLFVDSLFLKKENNDLLEQKKVSEELSEENILKIDDIVVKVDLAVTPPQRMQGLSGRKNLNNDSGLLFVFDYPSFYGFWMKEMNFPIDIIWFDENFIVVDVKKDIQPETFPETFYPKSKSVYVLEVKSGFSDLNNIEIGSQADFQGNLNF